MVCAWEYEIIKQKKPSYSKNKNKDVLRSKNDKEHYRNNNICCFCEDKIEIDKIRNQCHLTRNDGDPAHSNFNNKVTQ